MLAAFLGVLLGCQADKPVTNSQSAVGSAPTDPCATAGDGVRSIWDKQVADADNEDVRKGAQQMRDKLVARIVRHCRDDHWSAAAAACVRGGDAVCNGKLTDAQRKLLADDDPNK